MAESGLKGYAVESWFGLFAPAGTPPDIVTWLNAETAIPMRAPRRASPLCQQSNAGRMRMQSVMPVPRRSMPSASWPGETTIRSEAPKFGVCTRGMSESPGSGSAGMSSQPERNEYEWLNGCRIRSVLYQPQFACGSFMPSR